MLYYVYNGLINKQFRLHLKVTLREGEKKCERVHASCASLWLNLRL